MNLIIKQSNTPESVTSELIDRLYNLTKPDPITGQPAANAVLVGRITAPAAYEDAVNFLNTQFSAEQDNGSDFQVTVLNNNYFIRFADPNIVDFLVSKGVMQAGQGLTIEQAKTATVGQGVGTAYFFKNSGILSFDEFKYFTKFNTQRYDQLFCTCSLESVDLTNVTEAWWLQFGWASNLKYFNGRDSEEGTLSLPHFVSFRSTNAFENDTGIKKLLSLGSCTVLGGAAFNGCKNLTTIHQNICNQLTAINGGGFKNCPIANFIQNDETVTHVLSLPNLTTLKENAFARDNTNTTSFTEIASLGVVSVIGEYAFKNCTNLLTINFPNTISEIGIGAFDGTAWLAAQNNGPIYIAKVLYKCKDVSGAFVIPTNIVSITGGAFYNCSSLTSVTIGSGVASIGIGEGVFKGCTALSTVVVDSNNTEYDSRDTCNAIIKISSNTLIAGCKDTVIPNSITSISGSAFRGCTSLSSMTIPNNVTSIGNYAFYGCTDLASVTLYEGVTSIGSYAFADCKSLYSVTIPNSVTTIGSRAFTFGNIDTSQPDAICLSGGVTFGTGLTKIVGQTFAKCKFTSLDLPANITTIENYAIDACGRLQSIIMRGVTSIGDRAFRGSALSSITIETSSVPTIHEKAFKNDNGQYINNGNFTILVPSNLLSSYETAPNWSTLYNDGKIQAIPTE